MTDVAQPGHAAHPAFVAGLYPCWPSAGAAREAFVARFAATEWTSGLELPDVALRADPSGTASLLAPQWTRTLVTAIPGTMERVAADPRFGLASPDPTGRAAALAWTHKLRAAVRDMNKRAERTAIYAVELHSAPTGVADSEAFARSLAELRDADWGGARLLVEHCDRFTPQHPPEKGFLALEEELTIARDLGLGLVLNWGRMALEQRDPDAPEAAIRFARDAGVLAGVIFSGAAAVPTEFGMAWADGHHPPASVEPRSLLTFERIQACSRAAGATDFLGAKLNVPAAQSADERFALLVAVAQAAGVAG